MSTTFLKILTPFASHVTRNLTSCQRAKPLLGSRPRKERRNQRSPQGTLSCHLKPLPRPFFFYLRKYTIVPIGKMLLFRAQGGSKRTANLPIPSPPLPPHHLPLLPLLLVVAEFAQSMTRRGAVHNDGVALYDPTYVPHQ